MTDSRVRSTTSPTRQSFPTRTLSSTTSTGPRTRPACPINNGVLAVTGWEAANAVYKDTENYSSCVAVDGAVHSR